MRVSVCALLAATLLCGCRNRSPDVVRGSAAIGRYGCGSCHTIQGIEGANGLVGPPLTGIKDRMYIAGMLQNTRENMATWILDPKAVNDRTAMPKLGVSPEDTADIVNLLYAQ